ncbi:MAG: hypothetical protein KKE17_01785 [Proteobacteria bacterium]|nr:hypothetical protein [Pseudomonadota bacterium]MBU1708713.1 hypothetical protein [Pseudomonadota bacterium]
MKNKKLFFLTVLLLNSPSLYLLIPDSMVRILLLLPYLLWVNIPGIPLAHLKFPFYELHEFGAVPQNLIGWSLIVIFWIFVAGLLTIAINIAKYYLQKKQITTHCS